MLYYDFKAEIARGNIAPVYVIGGEDCFWSNLAYLDLISLADEVDTVIVDEGDSIDDGVWALGNYPMLGERKVVVVRNRKLKADEIKQLNRYAAAPQPMSVLVVYNCEGDVEGARYYTFDYLAQSELVPYIVRTTEERGGAIGSTAAGLLCEYCENNMTRINNEITKLISIGEITEGMIKEYVQPSVSYRVFDFTDAIAKGSYTKAYAVLGKLAANSTEYSQFFARLTEQVRLMLHTRIAKNATAEDIASALKVNPYPVQKARRAAASYTPKQLLKMLMTLYELEESYKSGGISVDNAMDLAIATAIEERKK